jgi:hypothetical protein
MPVGDISDELVAPESVADTRLADASAGYVEETAPQAPTLPPPPPLPIAPQAERDMNPLALLQEGTHFLKGEIDKIVVNVTPSDDHKPIQENLVTLEEKPQYDPYGIPLPPTFKAKDPQNPESVEAADHANMQMARVEIGSLTGAVGALPKAALDIVSGVAALIKGAGDYTVGLALDGSTKNNAALQKKVDDFNAMTDAAGKFLSNPLKPLHDFATRQRQQIASGQFSTAGREGGAAMANAGMAVAGGVEAAAGLPKLVKSFANTFDDTAFLTKTAKEAGLPTEGLPSPQNSSRGRGSKPLTDDLFEEPRLMDPNLDNAELGYDHNAIARMNKAFYKQMGEDLDGIIRTSGDLDHMVYQIEFPQFADDIDGLSRLIQPLTPSNIANVRTTAGQQLTRIKEYLYKISADSAHPFETDFADRAQRLEHFTQAVEEKLKKLDEYQGRH